MPAGAVPVRVRGPGSEVPKVRIWVQVPDLRRVYYIFY